MCPLYPFNFILLYICLIFPLLFVLIEGFENQTSNLSLKFLPQKMYNLIPANASNSLYVRCYNCSVLKDKYGTLLRLSLSTDDPAVALLRFYEHSVTSNWSRSNSISLDQYYEKNVEYTTYRFQLLPKFMGFSKVYANIEVPDGGKVFHKSAFEPLDVSVVRQKSLKSKVFAYSVAALVSLAYVNMGCAINSDVIMSNLKRPIGPLIGFICQFLFMPLISIALGFLFFSSHYMRLGLFVSGTSPGGGASNIWTLLFGGNLDLSLTMTTISTFSAFFMMPLWIYTVGPTIIFPDSGIIIPYYKLLTFAIGLAVPLLLGLLIRRYFPRIADYMVYILRPLSLFLITFIIVFGIWTNLYIFRLITWQVLVTGMGLPWLGFSFGYIAAYFLKRCSEDIIAIAIETGVQNTGVSIFILWFTLDQPLGDLTAIIPIAAAIFTPLPLLVILCVLKVRSCLEQKNKASGGKMLGDVSGMGNNNNTYVVNEQTPCSVVTEFGDSKID